MNRHEHIIGGAGLAALVVLVVAAFFDVAPALQGWLIALVFWSSVPIGALALILIHRLTGGLWGEAMAPMLAPAALTLPLFAVLFVPVVVGLNHVYVWAGHPGVVKPDIIANYLNLPGYLLRTLVAFIAWSLAVVFVVRLRTGKLTAALALAFHGLMISIVAVDWVLSADPHYTATAFGAQFAVQQLLAALAFTALLAPWIADNRARLDLAELMIATLVGNFYLGLMTLIIAWYGDLPDKAHWYLSRAEGGWQWVILASVLFGAVAPFLVLLEDRRRRDPRWLRVAGASILVGVLLHIVWWYGPTFVPGAYLALVAALVAIGAGFVLGWRYFAASALTAQMEGRHG